ncbi:MAG TPA: amino acid adenylation domain-containing protein, partial [Kofleriaceae bacterium]|nr:amino acid adenylation domain-containing protein [Kofleriaceae bacterium]
MTTKRSKLSPEKQALLAKRLRALRGGDAIELAPIPRDGRDGPFPLSSGQERLWFVDQFEPNTSTYNVPLGVRWQGALDVHALERALRELVVRHEALRTRFDVEDGSPVQRIGPADTWSMSVVDVAGDADPSARAARLANEVAEQAFDLSRGPLFRATLLRIAPDEHLLVLVMHHTVTDGWSFRILHRELFALYTAFVAEQPSPLTPIRLTYVDYATWQRKLVANGHHDAELAYWKRALAGAPTLELPTDRPRPAQQTFRGASCTFALRPATARGLTALARAEAVTLPIAMLGAFAALVARYAGQRDVVIGTPVANRTHLDLEPMVGFFVNMLAIRVGLEERLTTRMLFQIARDRMLEAEEHGKVPFDRVVEALQLTRDRSRSPLFQVAFRVNEPVAPPAVPGGTLTPFAFDLTVATYDLLLSIDAAGDRVSCTFDFNADLFERDTIERMSRHFDALLAAMIADPDRAVGELALAPADDRDLPVQPAPVEVPEACVHELIAAHARRSPDAIAVQHAGAQRTYRELAREATQLARRLVELGVGPDVVVGLHLDHSIELVVAMLAVLEAGGAYLPLDPALPVEQLAKLAVAVHAKVVVAARDAELPGPWQTLRLADVRSAEQTPAPVTGGARLGSLAMVTFPRPTAEHPVGVVVEHRHLAGYVAGVRDRLGLRPGLRYAATWGEASAATIVFTALCNGGTLELIAQAPATSSPAADVLVLGDQAIPWALAEQLAQLAPSCAVVSHYTAAAGALVGRTGGPPRGASVPLGHPLPGQRAFVLEPSGGVCPTGVAGELCIGGAGGARGYAGTPEALSTALVADPLAPGDKLLRTGIRARRLSDGAIEHLGKLETQAAPGADRPAAAATTRAPAAYVAPSDPTELALAEMWRELLGIERIGIHDDFFALGGHSLLAARLVTRIRARLDIALPIRALFDAPTIARTAAYIAARRSDRAETALRPVAVPRSERPPLSFAQHRLWFLHQLEPDSAAYLVAYARRYDGLDVERLRGALEALVRRHEILRTSFPAVDGEPYQRVHPPAPMTLAITDARALDAEAQAALLARIDTEQRRTFDLAAGPPLRFQLVRVGPDAYVLFVTLHHIITDGGSFEIFWRELWACYDAGGSDALPALPLQYADFAASQRAWLSGDELARQLAFWTERLRGAPEETELPFKGPRPPRQTFRGREHVVTLDAELTTALRELARRHDATLFMTLAAAFRVLLVRYTGQRDVLLGTAIDNRTAADVEELIGMFANTVVLRTEVNAGDSFSSVLAREKAGALAAYDHQHTPFELVVDALGVERSLSRPPVVQVMYVHQGAAEEPDRGTAVHTGRPPTAEFDLTLVSWDHGGQLALHFLYNVALLDDELLHQLGRHLRHLLGRLAHEPARPLAAIDLLEEADHAQLRAWNAGELAVEASSVYELVVRQIARTPDAIAVVHANAQLTYRELGARSERVAAWLAARGVARGDRVALCVERSADMIAALLGVLRVGAAYVPIDPEYPEARRQLMRDDTGASVELTDATLREALGATGSAPHAAVAPEDVAYIIYTSGSTGTPKGVRVPHRSVANYLAAMRGPHGVTSDDTVAAIASLSFDAHVIDLLLPLVNGARIVVADRDTTRDGDRLAALLDARGVTFMFATPATWRALLSTGWRPSRRMRVHAGGEAVPPDLAATLLAHAESVWNGYGPTETTVYVSCTRLEPGKPVTLGRPLANLRAHVLDVAGQPAPVGVAGELYVGGAGVALGYHHRPALTAERFVPDPFASVAGARMYRTGDRVRWSRAGALEFLGRVDTQVKLRGLRIELGEIEAALRAFPGIADVVVVLRDDLGGSPQLVAYLVTHAPLDQVAIRSAVRTTLPDYMVPSAFVTLDALPLTSNGKLDRRALPAPGIIVAADYVAPRDPIEAAIAASWRDLLGIERVGVHDDFFALGGHSLLATRALSRIRSQLDVDLPVRALFEAPTVGALAARVAELRNAAARTATRAVHAMPRPERTPLSYAQQRLWFLHQLEPHSSVYVITRVRRLGAVEVEALRRAFEALIARHEILRTSFPAVAGEPYQHVHPPGPWTLPVEDLRGRSAEAQRAAIARIEAAQQRPFDLAAAAPLRTQVVRVADDAHLLFVTLHHILTDGWSEDVMWRELWAAYDACVEDRRVELAPLPIQYADYAVWQRGWLAGAELARQLAFWTERLAGAPEETALPRKGARPPRQTYGARWLSVALDAELSARLRELARAEGASLFMVFAASLRALLARYSGQSDIVLGTAIANRDAAEVEGLVGMFVNTLVLRNEQRDDDTFATLLARE